MLPRSRHGNSKDLRTWCLECPPVHQRVRASGNRALRPPADPCKTFGMKVRVFCLAKRRVIQETLQHLRLPALGPEVLTKQLSRLLGAYCTSLISVAPVTNGIDTCTSHCSCITWGLRTNVQLISSCRRSNPMPYEWNTPQWCNTSMDVLTYSICSSFLHLMQSKSLCNYQAGVIVITGQSHWLHRALKQPSWEFLPAENLPMLRKRRDETPMPQRSERERLP